MVKHKSILVPLLGSRFFVWALMVLCCTICALATSPANACGMTNMPCCRNATSCTRCPVPSPEKSANCNRSGACNGDCCVTPMGKAAAVVVLPVLHPMQAAQSGSWANIVCTAVSNDHLLSRFNCDVHKPTVYHEACSSRAPPNLQF